jgi:hypothetical protein
MPTAWKMPPIVKVYEAIGALGDGRVRIEDDARATVRSSEGTKVYDLEFSRDGREISSNDNASYWQGYLGYPAIAVLIERGILKRPPADAIEALSGVPWKEMNRKLGNDYAKTIAEVERIADSAGHDPRAIRAAAEAILEELRHLAPHQGKRRKPPAERS